MNKLKRLQLDPRGLARAKANMEALRGTIMEKTKHQTLLLLLNLNFYILGISGNIWNIRNLLVREDHHRTPKHRLRPSFRPCVHHGMQAGSETILGSGIREYHHWTPGPWKYHLRTSMPVVSCQARGCRMCACMHLRFMVLQTLAQTD